VVALESTIITHGMDYPINRDTAVAVEQIVRDHGAVPATIAIVHGVIKIGLSSEEIEMLSKDGRHTSRKCSRRDLAYVLAKKMHGSTTVAGTMYLAQQAGIKIFATGGIGGVHRAVSEHGDISADLGALASHPVVTVCAGAKSFLDLPRTLEHLETIGVPVVGVACNEFPAFTVHSSGLPIPARVDDVAELSRFARAHWALGRTGGILTCVPVPLADSLDKSLVDRVIEESLLAASSAGVEGPAVTPFVLARIAEATGFASVGANLALAENNARVAAELAVQLTRLN